MGWKDFWILPTLNVFWTPPPTKKLGGGVEKTWRWCQILKFLRYWLIFQFFLPQMWQFLTISDEFWLFSDKFWPFLKIFDVFWRFFDTLWQLLPLLDTFLTISDTFWHFLTLFLTIPDTFWRQFLTIFQFRYHFLRIIRYYWIANY